MNSNQFPDHWEFKPLKEIARVITGKTPPTKNCSCWNGCIPFITPGDLKGNAVITSERTITEEGLKFVKTLPYGTVLVSCIGYIGKVGVLETSIAVTNQQINSAIPNEDILDNWYLAYAFIFLEPLLKESAGITTVPILNKSSFESINIPLPPLPEQRAISHVLRAIQHARETRLHEIALERERKAALMEHLFTHGTRGEPTKQTEIGEMPESWEIKTLGSVSEITSGGTPSRSEASYWNGKIPWVKTGEINYNVILETEEKITDEGLRNSAAKIIPSGTPLIAMYGQGITRGKAAILGIDATLNQACAAILIHSCIDAHFLLHFLKYSYGRIRNLGHGANQKNLNAALVKSIIILIPEIYEQKYILETLNACDSKITTLEHEVLLFDELFRDMLEELMSGRLLTKNMLESHLVTEDSNEK